MQLATILLHLYLLLHQNQLQIGKNAGDPQIQFKGKVANYLPEKCLPFE